MTCGTQTRPRTHTPVPSVFEQICIDRFLDRETAKIDGMVAKVETAIERLQEYRTALITAAVTGKIGVRGAAATWLGSLSRVEKFYSLRPPGPSGWAKV